MHGTSHTPSRGKGEKTRRGAKAFWMKQLHSWHWISSAVSLIGLLLFAFTGITLNHAADVEGAPTIVERSGTLPAPLLALRFRWPFRRTLPSSKVSSRKK